MANSGQGPTAPGADLQARLRQYRQAWHDALQRAMSGQDAADTGASPPGGGDATAWPFRAALEAWMHAATGQRPDLGETLSRVDPQAGDWLTLVQQLAGRFAGQDTTPEAIVEAWREMLGGKGADPLARMSAGPGVAAAGWQAWAEWLASLSGQTGECRDGSQLPTFGLTREHQARWQELARVFAGYQRSQQAYQDLLAQASQEAFKRFERRLRERSEPVDSPRALFDLWIDAAEEAYAEVALSPPFRSAYADMVAGQMRLRQAVQREIEHGCRLFDLPTRSELDGAHRKLAELGREVRRLRDRLDAVEANTRSTPAAPSPRTGASSASASTPPASAGGRGRGRAAASRPGKEQVATTRAAKQAASGSAAERGTGRTKPATSRARSASAATAPDDRATRTSTAGAASTGARTKQASSAVAGPSPPVSRPGARKPSARAAAATGQRPASRGPAAPGTATSTHADSPAGSGAAARTSTPTGNVTATRTVRRTG